MGCILSQISDMDNELHPIAFHSRSLSSSEISYTTYDKELLAIITAFETWCHHLEGVKFPVQIITDHRNLLYFKKSQHLNQRQIRWSLFLSKFDFRISFRHGSRSSKPDSSTRRPDYNSVVSLHNKDRPLLDDNAFCCVNTDNISSLIDAQTADTFCKSILEKIKTKSNTVNKMKPIQFAMPILIRSL